MEQLSINCYSPEVNQNFILATNTILSRNFIVNHLEEQIKIMIITIIIITN